ncbi:low molecular weight protein-tyrosine-phosphatase [uncultured Roseibium sp.]|uniref:low molecular weight protein-tyrosine-phosphatase n=1 Tax=uncultured Roseibium sp. TaxID=1936171 RepID=UPI00260F8E65|nr:low molecular weight protein-tyrosine-phosphatase [uncultured Roseibium sp.]
MVQSVLFVCLGNICRSPLAEGVFRSLVFEAGRSGEFEIDSAGTGAWHIGDPPDPRSIEIAAKYGVDITGQKARQVSDDDFDRFDTIVAMDCSNLTNLNSRSNAGKAHIRLLLDDPVQEVPDPYCGGPDSFENVYQMIRAGGRRLLSTLTDQYS